PITIVAALLMGVAVGAFHGYFIAYMRIPAFIVTLAGMLVWRGLTEVILQGQTKAPFDPSFQAIAAGYLPGMDLRILNFNIIAIIFGLVLSLIFVVLLLNARKNKIKYEFEVLPPWIEAARIAFIVAAINLLTFSLADYNGIPIILILLVVLVGLYTFI